MDYEAPALEMVGSASELIQAYAGPTTDGGGWAFSRVRFVVLWKTSKRVRGGISHERVSPSVLET
jgi:hypothetical protein